MVPSSTANWSSFHQLGFFNIEVSVYLNNLFVCLFIKGHIIYSYWDTSNSVSSIILNMEFFFQLAFQVETNFHPRSVTSPISLTFTCGCLTTKMLVGHQGSGTLSGNTGKWILQSR